ncbi:MAG: LamG-like jellyroll fold domain-containing protein [Coleofasciculus chthonoplastes F3-SA18-01]|uniref:LamG-like jellyroll fold domain-containing protein n=1 Tax=Coleofasciculus chthonoplastes TaxID=64178 RepID=UPI0032FA901C
MLLQKEKLQYLNSIAHEGKVVVFATDAEGQIHYTIKQDGFEDSYLNTPPDQRTGWEQWKLLEFPNESTDDASVVALETEEFTRQDNAFLVRSRYQTQDEAAVAPVQLVSGVGHIYVFRQSKENTLLCDRFVLDGMTNELTRKLEVRFKRSRQKHKPTEDMRMGASGLQNVDSLDYRDTDNNFFYEPTTELKCINNLHNGWFSVVQVATNEHDKYRWHIFAYNRATQKVQLTTIRTSDEGLFDLKDYTVLEPISDTDDTLVPRSIPGIIQRTLDINGVSVTHGLAVTKYDIQQEQETKAGPQLMRMSSKVMLVIPTDKGTAALSFGIAGDGTLSQIDEQPQNDVLRSTQRDVLLPLNTLEQIKAFGDTTPPEIGSITGFSVGTEADGAEDLVKITSPEAANLVSGDMVEIQNTNDYNGLYAATRIDEDTFTIDLPANEEMGTWEAVEEEGGLIFDGMVTGYQKTADGKLQVTASNHGLEDGDEVLLVGTQGYDNTYQIQKVDDANFVIQRQWPGSEAVNVKLESRKRRGIVLDGKQDYVDCDREINLAEQSFTIELWAKRNELQRQQCLIGQGEGKPNHALLIGFRSSNNFFMAFWENAIDTQTQYDDRNWHHWACTYDSETKTQTLYCDGKLARSRTATSDTFAIGNFYIGSRFDFQDKFNGCIANVRIWETARTAKEVKDSMYLQLTGKEVGLVGYWRLGAISEGKERKVVDFSVNGNDGIVYGDPYVGGVTLDHTLRDGMPAVKYSNDDLFAVSQRATYIEEFEFKVNPAVDVNNADGNGNQIFQFYYWGKTSRSADEKITISAQQDDFESLGNSWYRATCRFTIPDGVAMLRTFEIADVRGNWTSLEIRKHYIRMVSDAITEAKYGDYISLATLADNSSSLKDELRTLEEKERQESILLEEKSEIEKLLALLADAAKLDAAIAAKQSEINTQQSKIDNLLIAVNNAYNHYQKEINNTLNYWCKFVCRHREDWIVRVYTQNNQLLYADLGANGNSYYSNNKFKFEQVDGGYYRIVCMSGNKIPIWTENKGKLYAKSTAEIELLASQPGWAWFIKKCQEWKLKKRSDGYYIIENRLNFEVWNWATSEHSILVWPEYGGTNQQWKIVKIGGETNNNISQARQTWEQKKNELQNAEKKLVQLQEELEKLKSQKTNISGNKAELEQRLQIVIAEIQQIRNELNIANTNFITGVKQNQQTALAMSQLAQDSRDLTTQGALVGFVHPAGRLNAIETCEGNVQLSYFDDQGRMRQTLYDATSDRLNTAFEQWIPDSLRTCINFNNGSSLVKLNDPLYFLGENFTVEAWFAYPFSEKLQWHVLASSQDNEQQIVVYNSQYLGLCINGVFFDCGYDLEKLSDGWHHLAIAAKREPQSSVFAHFYIDGEKVGETQAKPAVQLDGNDDFISLPAMNVDYSVGFTIEAWVHYASFNTWSRIIDFGIGFSAGDIILGNEANTDTLFISVGGIYLRAPNVLETKQWMHLAATVDIVGNVTIYKNGLPVATGKASVPASINRTNNFIGKSNWQNDGNWDGEIAEVRLWKLPRTQTEIQGNLGKTLKGEETGLVGYWQLAGGAANDSSLKGYNGTIQGTPKAVTLPAKITGDIYTIGNLASDDSTSSNNTALEFDGTDDYIEFAQGLPSVQTAITIEFWSKGASTLPKATSIIEGYNSQNQRVLNIHLPWINQTIYWDAGNQNGCDRIEKLAQASEYKDSWTHWAFVKDASTGQMLIYHNGAIWYQGSGKTKTLSGIEKFVIGAYVNKINKWSGSLGEFRIWNKARTQAEIQGDMGKTLTGGESGLVGYWPLRDGSAKDYSPNGNNDTLNGNPQTVPFDQVQLQKQNTNQFGKLAEVRIWGISLSDEEIAVNSKTLLSGNEPGLLAYYPMTEATGNEVRDYSGNNRHGTMQGASWWGCAAPIGNLGHTVMKFDGKNDYIATETPLLNNRSAFTLEGWVKASSLPAGMISLFGQNDVVEFGIHKQQLSVWTAGGAGAAADTSYPLHEWHHVAVVGNGKNLILYLDGTAIRKGGSATSNYGNSSDPFKIAAGVWSGGAQNPFCGQMAEVRIWKQARTPAEIRATMNQRLSGNEAGLLGYWPLNTITPEGTTVKTPDLTGNYPGTVHEAITTKDNTLPIGGDALVSSEYSTITVDPSTQRKSAMMRRFFASPVLNGAEMLPEKRIEQLQLQWIGNAQFAPTLLGYIEGAPPIPSENLTESDDYNGATSVELAMSEDVDFSWSRAQDSGLGASAEIFAGIANEAAGGLGYEVKLIEGRLGFKGALDFSYQFINESNITSSSSNSMTDSLQLRGTPEKTPKFPHLGTRFIPKNVGYALVISSLADVFISKLARSGKMVGYQVQPVDGIPPDVNTITFLMNPAYSMNGSLDGMTGSSATSDRFFRHVPEMRSQYGSLYPASYYRLQEAYNLKQAIEREDKRRESYFQQFNARLLDEASLSREANSGVAPGSISVEREEDQANTNLTEEEQKAAEEAKMEQMKEEIEASQDQQSAAVKQKQAEIDAKIADQEKRAHATESFAGWQKKMENILIRAGKRNIVNTYVWDADGGLRAEAQSFATTAEHTIGGSFSLGAGLGVDTMFMALGGQVELTALATVNMTQTMTKTEARSKGFELNVDLSGVESIGITDYNDYPIMPGEKVDRYRFMSFYLENSTDNFYDFFNYVVDPEWLRSNDEEARALRQAMGKANKTWRVLHRVTYVERPALMGFGRDVRKLVGEEDELNQRLYSKVEQLEEENKELKQQLDEIMQYLKTKLP